MRWKIATTAVLALGIAVPAATATAAQNGTPTACETAATTITIVKGSGQSAVVGSEYGQQLELKVTDGSGNPVTDCPVNLAVTAGSGGAGATIVSNGRTSIVHHTSVSNGTLREQIKANAHAGAFTVVATVVNNTAVTATFDETNNAAKASSSIVPSSIAPGACTKFYFSVNTTTWNTVSVYGARGNRRVLAELGTQGPGLHAWTWCGKDSTGAQVQPGTYTVKLAARVGTGLSAPIVANTQQNVTVK